MRSRTGSGALSRAKSRKRISIILVILMCFGRYPCDSRVADVMTVRRG
jgi:hypothetical protein